jgi:hypothetical protein
MIGAGSRPRLAAALPCHRNRSPADADAGRVPPGADAAPLLSVMDAEIAGLEAN